LRGIRGRSSSFSSLLLVRDDPIPEDENEDEEEDD